MSMKLDYAFAEALERIGYVPILLVKSSVKKAWIKDRCLELRIVNICQHNCKI